MGAAVSGRASIRYQIGHAAGRDPLPLPLADAQPGPAAWSGVPKAAAATSTPPATQPQPFPNGTLNDEELRARLHRVGAATWDDAMSAQLGAASAIGFSRGAALATKPDDSQYLQEQTFGQQFQAAALQHVAPALGSRAAAAMTTTALRHGNHEFRELQALMKRMRDTNAAFGPFIAAANAAVAVEQQLHQGFMLKIKRAAEAARDVDTLKLQLKFGEEELQKQLRHVAALTADKSARIQARTAVNESRREAMTAQFAQTWSALCTKLAKVPAAMLDKLRGLDDPNVHYLETLLRVLREGCASQHVLDLTTLQGAARELHAAMAAVCKHFQEDGSKPLSPTAEKTVADLEHAEQTALSGIARAEARLAALKSTFQTSSNHQDAEQLLQWESQLQALQGVEVEVEALQKKRVEIAAARTELQRRIVHAKILAMYGRPRGLAQCAELDALTTDFQNSVSARALQTSMFAGLAKQEGAAAAQALREAAAMAAAARVHTLLRSLERLLQLITSAQQVLNNTLARTRQQALQTTGAAMQVALTTAPQFDQNYYAEFCMHWEELCRAGTDIDARMVEALRARLLQHAYDTPHLL